MKRVISISVFMLLVISMVSIAPVGYPCGGKFLGIKDLQSAAPVLRPATILLYKVPRQLPLALKRMGHRVKTINESQALLAALKAKKGLDLVIGNLEEIESVKQSLKEADSAASVVPIIAGKDQPKDLLMKTRKEFACVVTPKGGMKSLVREVNRAIKLKDKAAKKEKK